MHTSWRVILIAAGLTFGACAHRRPPEPISPKLLSFPGEYPEEAVASEVEGLVTVRFRLTPEGSVVDPSVVSSTNKVLERAALQSLMKARFAPGNDPDAVYTLPIRYKLAE